MTMHWQSFALEHGRGMPTHHLAAVVQQPEHAIARLRATSPGLGRPRRGTTLRFAEAFARFNGRAPAESEWPRPHPTGSGGYYEWMGPELSLLASLVGQMGTKQIAAALTTRLRKLTGDPKACRNFNAVQSRMSKIGLQTSDVVGGITIKRAADEIGSLAIVQHLIADKVLPARRIGRLWVIPYADWEAWKAARVTAPPGYVRLSSIRERMAIASDKLSEMARLGYIPTAMQASSGLGGPSSQHGTWYIDGKVAEQLIADRHAGKPMPWHGKPLLDNLRATHKLWSARKHPASCQTCAQIWGEQGAPRTFEDYLQRYPPLAHGAKRHLTMKWSPGLTVRQLAEETGKSVAYVHRAIANGVLHAEQRQRKTYVTRTDATLWKTRKCPSGDSHRSWIALPTATRHYHFSEKELRAFIAAGKLASQTGTVGPQRGILYVAREGCAKLRKRIGYTEEQAAARIGVSVARARELLAGVNWRGAEHIPLDTIHAAIKRMQSQEGSTIAQAAAAVGKSVTWVQARIDDGTVRVLRTKWDGRLYFTAPMLERLRQAARAKRQRKRSSIRWLRLSDSAVFAGVSTGTILKWADAGELVRERDTGGWHYQVVSLRKRARSYWRTNRLHRAIPPGWLRASRATPTSLQTASRHS